MEKSHLALNELKAVPDHRWRCTVGNAARSVLLVAVCASVRCDKISHPSGFLMPRQGVAIDTVQLVQ